MPLIMTRARGICALGLGACLFAAPVSVQAQTYAERGFCPGVPEIGVEPQITLMRVVGDSPRVNFLFDQDKTRPKCPDLSDACKRKGFVVPGDEVLVGELQAGLACVTYIAPNVRRVKGQFQETNGFLPATALVPVSLPAPRLEDWLGKWSRNAEAEITISRGRSGKLVIKGEATFGALDPQRVARGGVNFGDLEAEVAPKGNRLHFGEGYTGETFPEDAGECQARMHLFGRYLVVEDSGGCGGINLRFIGVYVRLK
jgi:hypothetical protein